MTAFLVFNELSAATLAPDQASGARHLDELAEVLLDPRLGRNRVLVAPPSFPQVHVCDGYPIGRWLSQYCPSDRDRRQRIRLLLDRSVLCAECVDADQLESGDVEYTCTGRPVQGLPTAFLVDGIAVSLRSSEQWDVSSVSIEKSWIVGSDVETRVLNVAHAGQPAHLEVHREWLLRIQSPRPANGQQLWDEKASLFPGIDFCDSVEPQITALGGNQPRFKYVVRGLRDLQNYCASWVTPNFDIHQVPHASGESRSTLEMYGDERTFRCPDGLYRLFEWHLKRGDTRIHFFDFPAQKRILVGYAGDHLRISSQ